MQKETKQMMSGTVLIIIFFLSTGVEIISPIAGVVFVGLAALILPYPMCVVLLEFPKRPWTLVGLGLEIAIAGGMGIITAIAMRSTQ